MPTARTDGMNAAIQLSLEKGRITVDEVHERMDGDYSKRSARRAIKEAEEFGWLQKRSKRARTWERGPLAREYFHRDNVPGYPNGDFPMMYYVTIPTNKYDFLQDENVLISAGVAWTEGGPGLTAADNDYGHLLVDSGGYQAAVYFQDEYPYSAKELHQFGDTVNAAAVYGMDWACEDRDVLAAQSSADPSDIAPWQDRLEWSFRDQLKQYDVYKSGRYDHEFRPVVQGHDPQDFTEFAQRLDDSDMPTERIGIGTVCKRSKNDDILKVVENVTDILPDSQLHLFGATLNIWQDARFIDKFASSDSAAWQYHDPEQEGHKWSENGASTRRAYYNYKEKVARSVVRNP